MTLAKRATTTAARPLRVLMPLIKQELDAGTAAGLEHYRRAGEMLIEAKSQMPYGSWGNWLSKNFELSQSQAIRYMRLAEHKREAPDSPWRGESLKAAIGEPDGSNVTRAAWRQISAAARELDADLFAQERQTQSEEVRLHRELAEELIDLGYKALATRLHPDRGGSKDAMVRLHRVRDELKSVAATRRFV